MKRTLFILTVVLSLVLSSCKSSSTDPKKAMCDSLNTLNTAVQGVKALTADTNLDTVKKSGQALEDAWPTVQKSTKKMKEPQLTDIRDSYKDMIKSMRSITDTVTLQQSLAGIQTSTQKFDTAYSGISTTSCANK